MSYASQLAARGQHAENRLGDVLDRIEDRDRARAALLDLKGEWNDAIEDGTLDPGEIDALRDLFRDAGMLDEFEALRAQALGLDDVDDAIQRALADAGRGEHTDQMLMALEMSRAQQAWESASNASKMEHDTYMNVIANIKA